MTDEDKGYLIRAVGLRSGEMGSRLVFQQLNDDRASFNRHTHVHSLIMCLEDGCR